MTIKELIRKLSEYPDEAIVGVDYEGWWIEFTEEEISVTTVDENDNAGVVTLLAVCNNQTLTGEKYNQMLTDACTDWNAMQEALAAYFKK